MLKKKIIIILSKRFPIKHGREGQPTNFAELLNSGEKKHTIRSNYDLWKVNEEKMRTGNYYISVRQWSGRPYRSKQVEIAKINTPITVQRIQISYHPDNDVVSAIVDGTYFSPEMCKKIAKNDGMSIKDFKEWFFGKQPDSQAIFKGCIIQFTDFKY